MKLFNSADNEMFLLMPYEILQRRDLSLGAKICFSLVEIGFDNGLSCTWDNWELIAKTMGISVTELRPYLDELLVVYPSIQEAIVPWRGRGALLTVTKTSTKSSDMGQTK